MSRAMRNSIYILLMSALMILFTFIVSQHSEVYAAETVESGTCGENAEWFLDDEGTLTITGRGAIDSYTFDHQGYYSGDGYYGKGTTDAPWFDLRTEVKSLVIEEGIVRIGAYDFYEMTNLTSVSLPNTLEIIDNEAFYTCKSLRNIELPNSIRIMNNGAFWNCSALTEFVIPEKVTTLSRHVIEATAISDLYIPATITVIEGESIWNCSELEDIQVAADNPNYSSYDGCLYNKNQTQMLVCPAQKEAITVSPTVSKFSYSAYGGSFEAFYRCDKLKKIEFDKNWKGETLPVIGATALTELEIPDSVITIPYNALANPPIEHIVLPARIKTLSSGSFANMKQLKTISIPASATSIHERALISSDPIIICEKGSTAESYAYDNGYDYILYDINRSNVVYSGSPQQPTVSVEKHINYSSAEMQEGVDYTLLCSNNVDAGVASMVIIFNGEFAGAKAKIEFQIAPARADNLQLQLAKTSYTYDGQVKTPDVTVKNGSITLSKDTDYTVSYATGRKNAGTYKVTVTLKGNYSGTASKSFTINKAANSLTIKAKTGTVKYSKLKKKAQSLAVTKVITFSKKGQGKMTYKKVSGNKKITINKTTGKVTIKKGLKKGKYKVKIKVMAGGTANYKASAWKTVTTTIKVK